MTPKRKRKLAILVFSITCLGSAVGLLLYALSENINYFYAPMELVAGKVKPETYIRAGGLVVPGSVQRDSSTLKVSFDITDGSAQVQVLYEGILPDLFQEGQGVVAEGRWHQNQKFYASTIIAKHDENYMPPEVSDALKKAHEAGKDKLGTPTTDSSYY